MRRSTVVCAVVIGGERLGAGEALAIVVVLFGALLASSDLAQFKARERIALLGILLALVTAVAIGVFVYGIAYFSATYGWLVPIFLAGGFRRFSFSPFRFAAENGAFPTARRGFSPRFR